MENNIGDKKKRIKFLIVPLLVLTMAGIIISAVFLKGRTNAAHTEPSQTQTQSESQPTSLPIESTTMYFEDFVHASAENELGEPAVYTETAKNFAIKIYYPKLGIEALDNLVLEKVKECAKEFKDTAPSSEEKKPALLKADYKVFTASKAIEGAKADYYSLVFELDIRRDETKDFMKEVRTLVLDAEGGKALVLEDFFRGAFKKRAQGLIVSYYSSQENTKELARGEGFAETLAKTEGIYNKFALSGNGIRFYFNPGTLLPEDLGISDARVRVADFGGLLKLRLAGFGIADGAKLVALTYDDGPGAKSTMAIAEILKANSSRATFFTLGMNARRHGDTIKNLSAYGFEVGCHSENHKNLTKIANDDALRAEALGHVAYIKELTGQNYVPFRAPYGATNERVLKVLDVPFFMWNIDPRDWAEKPKTAEGEAASIEKISARILDKVKDGDIILLHDIYDLTARSTAKFLPILKERGFEVVSVSELFDARGIELIGGQKYNRAVIS